MKNRTKFFALAVLLVAGTASFPIAVSAQFTWVGNSAQQSNGNWSTPGNWSPAAIPNGSSVDVAIPWRPGGDQFNGPLLDLTVQLHNLTLVNRAVINTPDSQPHSSLTVLGTTSLTVSPGHAGEYGILSNSGGTFTLGNFTNYDAATKTLESGGIAVGSGGVTQWNNADIVVNNGFIFMSHATSRIQRTQDSFNALTNLAVNNGSMQFVNGANFTTSGNFTNNGGIGLGGFDAIPTTFTVNGNLTNYDPSTGTLSGGSIVVDGRPATAIFRFANADIRALSGFARIELRGDGHVRDLVGNDAFRHLSIISGGTNFLSSGTMSITPDDDVFTNDGATHIVQEGSDLTINGDHHIMNNGMLRIGPPTSNSNTRVVITGAASVDAAGLDMGGTPGVNTQYHSELQVINGIEFRGAYLTGVGTTFADLAFIQGSSLRPGHSPGELTVAGNVSFDNTAETQIEIGGVTRGTEYDAITQPGQPHTFNLGCSTLQVFLTDNFLDRIQQSDSFDIITSQNDIIGEFRNVASGSRLGTSNAPGSVVVSYGPGSNDAHKVTVEDFIPLRIKAVSRQPGKIVIQGTSAPFTTHSISARQNFTDTPVQIDSVEADGSGRFVFEETMPSAPKGFYAVYFDQTTPGSCADLRPGLRR